MTLVADSTAAPRSLPIVDAVAPPERLAMFRILTGVFAVTYLLVRLPAFHQLGARRSGFDGVGVASVLGGPVPSGVIDAAIVVTALTGIGFVIGWQFRVNGPLFALGMLSLGSYRGSWGQLLHFENLMVLYLVIVAFSPAADAWSLDARRRARGRGPVRGRSRGDDSLPAAEATAYGFPIGLASFVLVATYVVAGIAKLRYGGLDWVVGDTLRNHVAYAAVRADLLGGTSSPLAGWGVRLDRVWPLAAAGTILVELAAPVALLGGRLRTTWVICAWLMHLAIVVFMLIVFPMPLFLAAFAPLYRIERLWIDRPAWLLRPLDQRAD